MNKIGICYGWRLRVGMTAHINYTFDYMPDYIPTKKEAGYASPNSSLSFLLIQGNPSI